MPTTTMMLYVKYIYYFIILYNIYIYIYNISLKRNNDDGMAEEEDPEDVAQVIQMGNNLNNGFNLGIGGPAGMLFQNNHLNPAMNAAHLNQFIQLAGGAVPGPDGALPGLAPANIAALQNANGGIGQMNPADLAVLQAAQAAAQENRGGQADQAAQQNQERNNDSDHDMV